MSWIDTNFGPRQRRGLASSPADPQRRMLLRAAMAGATGLAAAGLALPGPAKAAPVAVSAGVEPSGAAPFLAPMRRVQAGVLDVGYYEAGPGDGPAVLLLHGWPYDIHSFVDAAPLLASAGYRVIVPYLRGYGTTRFLLTATPRNG